MSHIIIVMLQYFLKYTSISIYISLNRLQCLRCGFTVMDYPQEFWRPESVFTIASNLGIPICIDSTSNKPLFDRAFGHYVRVLVDIDLTKELKHRILVERVGFEFFIEIEYERIPLYCGYCKCIGSLQDK